MDKGTDDKDTSFEGGIRRRDPTKLVWDLKNDYTIFKSMGFKGVSFAEHDEFPLFEYCHVIDTK